MQQPAIILDDAAHGRIRAYGCPLGVISADTPKDVPAALGALETVREMGLHAAGYFSYELGYCLEPKLEPRLPIRRDVPLLWFGVFDAPEKIEVNHLDAAFEHWCQGRAYAGALRYEWSESEYRKRFERVRALIEAGDLYEANLTFRAAFPFVGDPMALFRILRDRSAAPYGAYVYDGQRHILSLSPELFFHLSQGVITTRPMKGTAARKRDRHEDLEAREALFESKKDRAENLMIVDLLRNDLSRISQIGTVTVDDLFAVETYPTVHQMVSTVSGQVMSGISVRDIVHALYPCGSITGAPKIRAMEVIHSVEGHPRGIYCGAIGYFGPDFEAQFNVAIRTLTIAGHSGTLGIGGAVVHDSVSDGEYAESLLKARYMEMSYKPLELIETLRHTPEEGYVRQNLHLARMRRSAEFFHIDFDETAAIAAMDGATAEAKGPVRVRLSLAETGRFACTIEPLPKNVVAWTYVISPKRISSTDLFAQHKTNQRDLYDREYARLTNLVGCDEVLFVNERGEVAEGRRTNVFVKKDGVLITPPLSCGSLDGCLRHEMVEKGLAVEGILKPEDLCGEIYLGNSMRELIRAVAIV
jgi:para-aminobenzoate synthetase / 4-amino-4-deoxychorismate lyase